MRRHTSGPKPTARVRAVIDTRTPILYVHYTLDAGGETIQAIPADQRGFVYVFSGEASVAGETVRDGQLALLGDGDEVSLGSATGAELLVLAGVPLDEPVARYWPFVMNTSQQIAEAIADFRAGRMGSGRGWLIGGLPFDPSRTDVTTGLGDTEVWRLIADVYHPVHLHLVGFRVLSRNGRSPLRQDAGLKDTVALRPGEGVEIITRFEGWRGRYLFHCHNAEHEDMGMMANLEIV